MTSTTPRRRRRLRDAPLVLVLCEVRFAPVLAIDRLVADVQERLRVSGFPRMEASSVRQLQIDAAGPRVTEIPRWVFANRERDAFITLGMSSVSLLTTQYSQFEHFLDSMRLPIDVVNDVVKPAFVERVGLRYVDALKNVGVDAREYFKEAVLSFSADQLGVESLLSAQQVVARTKVGQLTIRMTQIENGPLLPPDLMSPELAPLSAVQPGVHAVLDIDSSAEQQVDFTFDSISAQMWAAHEFNDLAFWGSITHEAEAKWGIEEIEA